MVWCGVVWCGVVWCGVVSSLGVLPGERWKGGVLTWEDVYPASYSALGKYLTLLAGSDDTTFPPPDKKNEFTRFIPTHSEPIQTLPSLIVVLVTTVGDILITAGRGRQAKQAVADGNIKSVLLLLTPRHSTHKITESKLFFPERLNSPSEHTQISGLEYNLTYC